jgi:tetratricopeptide (TPR) repeat protein
MSLTKYIFGFRGINIVCSDCGAWLKAGKFNRSIVAFGCFIAFGFVSLENIYNWELGFFNIILILTIIVGIPLEIITWKYGVYEEKEANIEHAIETTNIHIKDRVLIAIFGITAIILGIISLYNHYYYIKPLIYSPLKLTINNQTGNLLFGLITGLGFILSIIIWGSHSKESYVLYYFFLVGILIWFFNRKTIKAVFQYHKNLKVLSKVWIVILTLEIVAYGILWFKYEFYKIPKPQQVVYQSKDSGFYSKGYYRSSFPLKYTIALPRYFSLAGISNDAGGAICIMFIDPADPQKDLILISNQTFFLEKSYSDFGRNLGYNSPYRFAEWFFSERYSIIFGRLRSITTKHLNKVERAKINDLNGFVEKGNIKAGFKNEIYLFHDHDFMGFVSIFGCKDEKNLTRSQMDEIIASNKYQEKPIKSAQEFFQDGLTFYNGKDIEKAKLSFASALCLDWENSQYHYYLGDCFFRDENWDSAKEHVEQAISIQPDYLHAKTLLEKIENKQNGT